MQSPSTPPPHGSVLRQPLLTAFGHHCPRAAGEASWKPELGQRGHSTSRPSARGRGQGGAGSRPQEGPNPAAPTTPSLTLLGICEQRLRNAAQRERAEERGSPHPPQPALRLLTGRSGRPEAPTQPLHPARVAGAARSHAPWPGPAHAHLSPGGGDPAPSGTSSAASATPPGQAPPTRT